MKTLNLSIWAILLFAFLLSGCKKDWEEPLSERAESAAELTARVYPSEVEEAFFSMEPQNEENIAERSLQPIVIDANNALYELNLVEDFVTLYHEQLGIPDWSKGLASQDELLWVPVYKDGAVNGILGVVRADSSLYFRPFFRPLYSKLSAIETPQSVPLILWLFDYFDTADGLGGDDELDFRNCTPPCYYGDFNYEGHTVHNVCLCSGNLAMPGCCADSNGPILDGGAAEAEGGWDWLFNFMDLLRNIFGDNGDFEYDDPWGNHLWLDYMWNLWNNGGTVNNSGNSGGGSSSNMNSDQRKVRLLRALLNEQFVYDWLIDRLDLPIGEDGFRPYHLILGGNPQISGPLYLFLNGFYDDVLPDPAVAMDLLDLLVDFGISTGDYLPPLDLTQAEMEYILGFENDLIGDIRSFLEANPNSAEAIQAVHDLMALQMCSMAPNNIGCQTTNYDNDLPLLLDFYSGLSQEAYDWFHSTDITNAGLKHIGLDFLLNGEMTPDADRKQHLAAVTEWAAETGITLDDDQFGWLLENVEAFGEIKEFWEDSIEEQEEQEIQNGILISSSYVPLGGLPSQSSEIGSTNYRHPIGTNGELPDDLSSGTNGDVSGLNYTTELNLASDDNLAKQMSILLRIGCRNSGGVYGSVAHPFLYNEFIGNTSNGDRFVENSSLNNAVRESTIMKNYAKHIGAYVRQALLESQGDFDNLTISLSGEAIDRPRFQNRTGGLGILINDTEQTKIHLFDSKFDEETGDFEVSLYFEIFDHFGLDKGDALEWGNVRGVGRYFEAWWHLQHRRGYTPFRTRITTVFELKGNIND